MANFWKPYAPPKSKLGHYRQLSPTAGVHVSPIQLGAMSIGEAWAKNGAGSGEMTKEMSFKLLDAYYENGGNFIDTANFYQDGDSEAYVGEWADARGVRDQLFIATKYSAPAARGASPDQIQQQIMWAGNNAKSMNLSFEQSLKRLRTSYIDLFYVHFWDWTTSIPELMHALHALVMARKVYYLGISDTPAWVVAKANQYARDHALTPFCIYQGMWNVMTRDFEREIIPMARAEGMALAPWNVLAAGKIRSDEEEEKRRQTGEKGRTTFNPNWERSESEKRVCKALEKVASDIGAKSITAVAIAYLMHKTTYVFPLVGGRKVEHLLANIEALDLSLTPEHIKEIESVVEFNPGFPSTMVGDGSRASFITLSAGHIDYQPFAQPITPSKSG